MHARRPDAATVVVSHDVDRMRAICDRYVMLERGRVVFVGAESALGDAPEVVAAFFGGAERAPTGGG